MRNMKEELPFLFLLKVNEVKLIHLSPSWFQQENSE